MNQTVAAIGAAVAAVVACVFAVLANRQLKQGLARAAWRRARDLAVLAEWCDAHAGTPAYPAPGSVAFYTLFPLEEWPADYFPPNSRMDGKCPFPEHDLRVVAPVDGGAPVWSATCQLCAAHWTKRDAAPPLIVAQQIQHKVAELPGVRF